MKKTVLSPSFKKILPFIIIILVLGVAAVLFFTMRAPKVEPLTDQQKKDFINYVDSNKIKPVSQKEKATFLKSTATQPVLTQEEKDSFLKSFR